MNKQQIINILNKDEIVCMPTDTVFGLAIKVSKDNSIKLATLKGSRTDKLFTIMVEDAKQALDMWAENAFLTDLVKKHFPGDITIIARAKNSEKYIGIRIPNTQTIIDIIKETGPIYATSTNITGERHLENIEDINRTFPTIALLNGECGGKLPSTIIKVIGNSFEIIRQGSRVV